jgi:lipopolysaccharide transport system permease protein
MALPNEIIIEAGDKGRLPWREIWNYRELFVFLAWRDILVRYKQTIIGIAWSVIRPLLTMIVFTIIFGRLAKFPSEGIPYPILVFAGLLPWQLFANAFTASSTSLVANASMISKVYFPRIIIPASAIIVSLVDFLITFMIMVGLMIWYNFWPSWTILTLPLFLSLELLPVLGLGILCAALNVKYRDFRYIVPFIVQLGLYLSPVGFSSDVIPESWRFIYALNPMVGVIDGFRWAMFGGDFNSHIVGFILSIVVSLILFFVGIAYFRKVDNVMSDVI